MKKIICSQSCKRKLVIVAACIVTVQIYFAINAALPSGKGGFIGIPKLNQKQTPSLPPSFFDNHPEEAKTLEEEFTRRTEKLASACKIHYQLTAAVTGKSAFLKLLPRSFDYVIMKSMAANSYSDDNNRLLVCSVPGVFVDEMEKPLKHFEAVEVAKIEKAIRDKERKMHEADYGVELPRESKKPAEDLQPPPYVEGLSSRPLLTYTRADAYTKLKTYQKIVVVGEPIQRHYTIWRNSIDEDVRSNKMGFYDIHANFTRFFYGITLKQRAYPNQLDICSLCHIDYDYIVHSESLEKELEFVGWKLGKRSSDLLFYNKFSKPVVDRLNLTKPTFWPGFEGDNSEEPVVRVNTTQTGKSTTFRVGYVYELAKMPGIITKPLLAMFQMDFSALNYNFPYFKSRENTMDDGDFLEWQRKVIGMQRKLKLANSNSSIASKT